MTTLYFVNHIGIDTVSWPY